MIADWRATLFRVGGFRQALIEMDKLGDEASRIELDTAATCVNRRILTIMRNVTK